jgi:hypothetical protein
MDENTTSPLQNVAREFIKLCPWILNRCGAGGRARVQIESVYRGINIWADALAIWKSTPGACDTFSPPTETFSPPSCGITARCTTCALSFGLNSSYPLSQNARSLFPRWKTSISPRKVDSRIRLNFDGVDDYDVIVEMKSWVEDDGILYKFVYPSSWRVTAVIFEDGMQWHAHQKHIFYKWN